ncbi:MAG TPA: hypothetical protein VLI67_01150, partial [Vicinamibacteria bacterium]|nr:hypothetical protein [Vicinamibacteria bacterium]
VLGLTGLVLAALAAGVFWWMPAGWMPALPGAPRPPAADAIRTLTLTRALVQTQLKLASRDLEDKNYKAAAEQAQGVLRLSSGNAEARRIIREANERQADLEAAVRAARRAVEAGDTRTASQELSRALELDPRHPAAGELATRLDSVFKSRAEDASRSMTQARAEAERASAAGSDTFGEATSMALAAQALFNRREYAGATRAFLESRDAFDRARRAAKAPLPTPDAATPDPSARPQVAAAAVATPAPPAPSLGQTAEPAPDAARRFVGGKTTIASRNAGGSLEGFDTADVKKRRTPDLAGRIEFEVTPAEVTAGEPYAVRIYLVNESRKAVRVKGLSVVTTVNGNRVPASISPVIREVRPQQRALLGELAGEWPQDVVSWSLDAAVTTDRDETGASRLSWM